MDIETINTLTVIGFGNVCLIFVLVWVVQTWREEFRRNSQKHDATQK